MVDIAVSREVASTPGRLDALTPPAYDVQYRLHHDAALGWSVSRGDLLEDRNIQCLLGDQLLEPGILKFYLFEALRLINPEPTIFLTPAIIRLLSHADLLARLCKWSVPEPVPPQLHEAWQ